LARKGKKGNANNAAVVREERPAEMNAAQHMLLAQTARRSGALDEAVGHYQSALQQGLPAEDEAKSLVGLGLALDAQGRREDARQMYIRALNHPGLPDAMREPTQIAIEAMSPKSTTPVASE
jgi:Flp pilus assembly protein TadD